ncbi:hypothetical protein CMV_016108 [Castanea mollissima]|uniref:PGG domain-containing protein n=1 Tax=Castanea mollissima TaxID=60419 RepID=A0A8J4VS08_9ROSI|nr:hypothetical protein CMV_016108 [Castanea mollissima]
METNNVNSNAVNSDDVITERRRLYMAALKGDWNSIEDMPRIQRQISKNQIRGTTLHIAAAANKEDFVEKLLRWMRKNPTTENVTPEAENVIGSTVTAESVAGNVIGTTLAAGNVIGATLTAENVTLEAVNMTQEAENVIGSTVTAESVAENVIGTTLTAGNVIGATLTAENGTLEAENVNGSTVTAENVAGNVIGATLTADDVIENSALTLAATVGNVNIVQKMLKMFNRTTTPVRSLFMASFAGQSKMVRYLYPMTNLVGDKKAEIFITCVKNDLFGEALLMLEGHPDLAGARNNIKTALHVLAHKPSAFVSASQPGMLRKHINILWLKKEKSKQIEANLLFEKCLQAYKSDVERFIEIPDISNVLFEAAKIGNIEFLIKLIHFDFDLLWKHDEDKTIFHLAVEERHENIFSLLYELGSVGGIIACRTNENEGNILHLAAKKAPQEKLNAISGAALQMRREILWFKEVEKVVSPDYKEMKNAKGDTPYVLFVKNHEELRKEGEKWMIGTANYSMVVATLIGSIMFSAQLADGLDQNPHIFLAFTVSTAISLCGSSICLIMFLSILASRYSFDDFLLWLPIRLLIGATSLYISIAAMMVAFATSFWLKNYNRDAKYVVIVLCALVPIIDVLLKFRLLFEVQSIFFRFRPRHRLLHEEVSYAPVGRPQSHETANLDNVSIQRPPHNDGE